MDGTGLPDPLHSNVMGPPLRACSCPDVGMARTLGGTAGGKQSERGGEVGNSSVNQWLIDVCALRSTCQMQIFELMLCKHVDVYSPNISTVCT